MVDRIGLNRVGTGGRWDVSSGIRARPIWNKGLDFVWPVIEQLGCSRCGGARCVGKTVTLEGCLSRDRKCNFILDSWRGKKIWWKSSELSNAVPNFTSIDKEKKSARKRFWDDFIGELKIRVETSETITLGWPSETWIRYVVGVKKTSGRVQVQCRRRSQCWSGEKFSREARDKPKLSFYVDIEYWHAHVERPPRIDTRLTFQGLITILPSSIGMNRIHFYPLLVHGRDLPHFFARSSSWKIEPTLARTLAVRRMWNSVHSMVLFDSKFSK